MARVSRKKQNVQAAALDAPARLWKTAIYVRLSVEDNGSGSDSIDNQISLLEDYISNHAYLTQIALYVDNGYTGTNFLRPEFQRMIEAAKAGEVECIVVKDLSRLGRNYIESARFIEKVCPFLNLRFIAVNDGLDTETMTNESHLAVSLSNIINDFYAKDISRKVTSALRIKMERGDYIGNYAPYGYKKDPQNKNHLIIDDETTPVIIQIYEWRAQEISYMGICKRLNDAGILSPSELKRARGIETNFNKKDRKILWNRHMIKEILNNVVYIGHLAQKKGSQCLYNGIPYHITSSEEWIVVKNTHQPLIDETLFNKVQEINRAVSMQAKIDSGKYAHLPKEQNLYGKRFICAQCGAIMKMHRSISSKGDKAYYVFKCPTYAEHGTRACSDVKIRKKDLDTAVFSLIRTQMSTFMEKAKIMQSMTTATAQQHMQSPAEQKVRILRQKLEHKQVLLSGMYVDFKEGLLTEEEYQHHRNVIGEDIHILESKLSELGCVQDAEAEKLNEIMKWQSPMEHLLDATEVSAEMVNAFIASMKLHESGKLEIELNFKDELTVLLHACKRIAGEVA